jgi:hypothetical protein
METNATRNSFDAPNARTRHDTFTSSVVLFAMCASTFLGLFADFGSVEAAAAAQRPALHAPAGEGA